MACVGPSVYGLVVAKKRSGIADSRYRVQAGMRRTQREVDRSEEDYSKDPSPLNHRRCQEMWQRHKRVRAYEIQIEAYYTEKRWWRLAPLPLPGGDVSLLMAGEYQQPIP